MSLEILRNRSAKSKLTRGFETCQESRKSKTRKGTATWVAGRFPFRIVAGRALAACCGAPGWPIVLYSGFAAWGGFARAGANDGARVCKPQLFVRSAICRNAFANVTGTAAIARDRWESVFAWTENIIVRTAGKLAK
jgi:hypothetical protein